MDNVINATELLKMETFAPFSNLGRLITDFLYVESARFEEQIDNDSYTLINGLLYNAVYDSVYFEIAECIEDAVYDSVYFEE